jgi:aminopeptidase
VSGVDPYIPERGSDEYSVLGYELELDYSVEQNQLGGRARVRVVAAQALQQLSLDLAGLRVSKVAVDGVATRWRHRGEKLHVTLPDRLGAGDEAVVEVRYAGKPGPTRSRWGPVGWEELADGVVVAAQPSGACTWFPCNDLAGQKAPVRVTATAPSAYRVVGNGALLERRVHGSTTTWTYDQVEATSPYLVTLHVGRYDEVEVAGPPVPIRGIVAPEHRSAFHDAFGRLPAMLDVFVDRFGPYPFAAGYTVVVCPEPLEIPLEAQGQAIFGTNHLAGDDERLIAHELAHQWFGNSLTAATWRDVWLHEGFACYAEWVWSEGSGGRPADEHAREHHARLARLDEDLVLGDPGPDDMFDDRVYKRGALTLHALRLELGDGSFFDLLRRWVDEHRHGVVTTEAFEALAAEVAGRSLDGLFDAWLRETALPELS